MHRYFVKINKKTETSVSEAMQIWARRQKNLSHE